MSISNLFQIQGLAKVCISYSSLPSGKLEGKLINPKSISSKAKYCGGTNKHGMMRNIFKQGNTTNTIGDMSESIAE